MPKSNTQFVCQSCGHVSAKWAGRCGGCGEWNTYVEELRPSAKVASLPSGLANAAVPRRIPDIPSQLETRVATGFPECDRVLGGGVVPGSLVLVGGDPGIGKSTLLLQLSHTMAGRGHTVLYVSGEESANQLKLRAERIGATNENLLVLAETDLDVTVRAVEQVRPSFLVIDSIQTMYRSGLTSAPGSVAQVRECTSLLLRVAKQFNIATFIVGHVTKDGSLAGPRLLEHMVDAVLYFEGERHQAFRVLRAVKNRFGSTNELAIFEMKNEGLQEVVNPSEMFLSERALQSPGSAVVAALEGSRPLLLEVQALVASSSFGTPRRMSTGADHNRVSLVMAVLEKRLGLQLQSSDAYVNVAGGMRVDEPAIDLGVALAVASSFRDRPLAAGDVYIGEVGLTGEVRSVSRLEQRIREAEKLGFARCLVPSHSLGGWKYNGRIEVKGVASIQEALQLAL